MIQIVDNCFRLLTQVIFCAVFRFGQCRQQIAAKIAMMAITTNNR